MTHEEFIKNLVGGAHKGDRIKNRERNDLNNLFSPEIGWEQGIVDLSDFSIGYIYT